MLTEGWYAPGTQIPVSAEPDDGYRFTGWTVGGSTAPELGGEASITFTMPNSDAAIGATFELITYSLSSQSAQGGTVMLTEGWYAPGTQIPVSAEPDDGYRFTGWTVGGSAAPELGGEASITFTMPDSETAIGATFELITYSLTSQSAQGGTVMLTEGWYAPGTQIPVSAEPDDGYRFTGWTLGGSAAPELGGEASITFTMPDSDTAIGATFELITYSLSSQSAQGGTVMLTEGWYAPGAQIPVSAEPDAGYRFTGWTVGGSAAPELGGEASITFTMPDSDAAIGATFELITYYSLTIQRPGQGGGTIHAVAGQYPAGAQIPVSAAPNEGYELVFWLIDGEIAQELGAQDSFTFTMPASDATISAVFFYASRSGADADGASKARAVTPDSAAAFAPASDSQANLGGTSDDPFDSSGQVPEVLAPPPNAGDAAPGENMMGGEASE